MADSPDWKPEHFMTAAYEYDDPILDNEGKVSVRLVIQVNGRTEVDMNSQLHEFEPGVIAFVSRPKKRGMEVVKVLPARGGYVSDAGPTEPAPLWARLLLGLAEK